MASREPELYKDKIEVNLDGRQIFYLFFGGSVIVGLVFVLGVMVGRRVEARGHTDRAHTAANVDPLAALDRLEGSGGLSFQGALSGAGGAPDAASDVDRTIADMAAKKADAAKPAVQPKKDEPKPEKSEKSEKSEKGEKSDKADKSDKAAKKDEPKPEKGEKGDKSEKAVAKKDEPKPEKSDKSDKSDKAVAKKDEPKADKSDKADKPKEEKVRYTLQLSSFQDRSEAQAFLDNLKSAGYQATLTEAEVEGKGTFYRIRYGVYRSLDAATDAKTEIEKAAHKSASIMKL